MAIITLAELKTHLGITSSAKDTQLQSVVDSTNAYISTYCNRVFEEAEYVDIMDGTGTNALVLANRPVTAITSVYEYDEEVLFRAGVPYKGDWATGVYYSVNNGVVVNSSDYVCILAHTSDSTTQPGTGVYWETYWELKDIEEEGYYYKDLSSGILFRSFPWARCRGCIEVIYTAGYSDENMPADLKFAALECASFFWNTKAKAGILSESLGSYSYRLATGFENSGGELAVPSINVRIILDKYKEQYFADLVY